MKKVTQSDIAVKIGCSPTQVGFALQERFSRVNHGLQVKIYLAAVELGYEHPGIEALRMHLERYFEYLKETESKQYDRRVSNLRNSEARQGQGLR